MKRRYREQLARAERRHQPRYPVDGIFGTLVPGTHVALLNLSRHGLAVRVPRRLPLGESYLFEFQHAGQRAHMEIRVTWCQRMRGSRGPLGWLGGTYVAGGCVVDIHREAGRGIWSGIQPQQLQH